uniref:Uncharacterized protein n=1 Tax=Heterosigma akashiwo TaxID=2829 RepID=A0A7S3XM16_HETAK
MMLSSRDRGPNWQVENFLRSAFSHPRQPAVVAVKVDSSGKSVVNANPPKCKPYKLPLPGDKSIPEKYFGRNLEMMRRYSDAGYGIQFWSVDEARSCCQDCIKSERFTHSWSVKDKAFRGGDWHPGPHGHYLAGQVLAYSYGRLFLEAARAFAALKASGADLDPGKLGPAAPAGPLPAPQTKPCADEPMCLQADTRCYTTFEPKGGQDLDLASFVAAPPTRFNETRPALPTPCGQPLHGRQACLDYHGLDRWIGGIWPLDEKAVLSKGVPAGYLDRKWCLLGRAASGPLRLDLNAPRAGPGLRVCHASGDFGKYPNGLNAQVQTYQFRINGKDVLAQQVSEDTSLCAKIDISVEAGPFELEISAPSDQLIAISHVILP